jgi:hypothetical protein
MAVAVVQDRSRVINETCDCKSLDRTVLARSLIGAAHPEHYADIWKSHPYLFAETPVYVSRDDISQMERLIASIESLAQHPAYRAQVASRAPEIAQLDFGLRGVFMGYDFHLSPDGPRLIEINTNAGGAFLNSALCDAQRFCCEAARHYGEIACPQDLSKRLAEMFVEEWRLQRGTGLPKLVAIVDDDPAGQYLYPDFVLAVGTLKSRGIDAVIADPQDLEHRDGRLWHGERVVDLVYNRLVDFYFDAPGHRTLRDAYVSGNVVVTPNPFHHALFADKRNLVTLSDPESLSAHDIPRADQSPFAAVPVTRLVTAADADELWARRNGLFFKPLAGHGGKAVYRGDKLTKRVWGEILAGQYVAQERVSPSERLVALPDQSTRHKFDIRLYTYAGRTLLAAARLYQGQTTNFRTPGGGFAPVIVV